MPSLDPFERHCRLKAATLRQDEDWVSCYDGREGSGKSNGAIWDALATSRDIFKLDHICYDPEDFMRLIDDVPRFGTIVIDEAGEAFFSRSFRSEFNVAIAKALQQMRFRNLNVILCVPHKDYIDLIGRVRVRTWVHFSPNKRGHAEFMAPTRTKFYSRDEPFWNSLFYYQFPRLPKHIYEQYKAIKIAKSKERLARYVDEVERKREKGKDERPNMEKIMEVVNGEAHLCKNSRGRFDRELIQEHLRIKGLEVPIGMCRTVALRLNSQNSEA